MLRIQSERDSFRSLYLTLSAASPPSLSLVVLGFSDTPSIFRTVSAGLEVCYA